MNTSDLNILSHLKVNTLIWELLQEELFQEEGSQLSFQLSPHPIPTQS